MVARPALKFEGSSHLCRHHPLAICMPLIRNGVLEGMAHSIGTAAVGGQPFPGTPQSQKRRQFGSHRFTYPVGPPRAPIVTVGCVRIITHD